LESVSSKAIIIFGKKSRQGWWVQTKNSATMLWQKVT